MKEVKAIIQPFMFQSVLEELGQVDHLPAATVSKVDGYSVVHPEYTPKSKLKLEIMIPDELVESVIRAIEKGAHTGNPGDGAIFVIDVTECLKIRTGERKTS